MNRMCDTGAICPHTPQCDHFCHFTNAELKPETRKVKPYPSVPADIEPVSDQWHTVGALMLGFIMAMVVVAFALIFFTGLWVWSLLI